MTETPIQLVYFLLVDDREQNLIALETLLRREGLSLLKARSGREALELLLKYDVALALIDVQMPGMDGFELAELMRGTERTRRVPIIFLTAGSSSDYQRRFRGYEAGAVDFLHKPIEPDVLKSKTGVFFDLYCQRQEVARQRDELAVMIVENKRLLEESRQYAHALQEGDRKKDEFLATLAHELRNPLAPILSAVQLLNMTNPTDPETTEVHEIIERQVDHMVRLVDDLLEVSRITSGKIQLQHDLIELNDVIRNAIETSQPLLEGGKHHFRLDLNSGPIQIEGDMVRLTQVLSNLLNNAAKYTPEGGHISLTTERQNTWALVRIKDTGLGIPPDMLTRIFEMFTQVNRHMKRSRGGLGIGLTLVKRLVELHGGQVQVASDGEGRGSEFTVRLPITQPAAQDDGEASPRRKRNTDSQRVLIVDDHIDGLNSLKLLLSACGYQVEIAHDGPTGIQLVESFQPDAVFLDIGMPVMDGYETARQINMSPHRKDLTLIALTGWGQEDDRTLTRDAGFDFHVVKPVNMASIQKLLKSRKSRIID